MLSLAVTPIFPPTVERRQGYNAQLKKMELGVTETMHYSTQISELPVTSLSLSLSFIPASRAAGLLRVHVQYRTRSTPRVLPATVTNLLPYRDYRGGRLSPRLYVVCAAR